jgi:catechol 2,3-dioxygenase-like lactoylglutathione lyase family enzyme
MEPRVTFVTLGVHDLARERAFYHEGLGWPLSSMSQEDVAFFRTGGTGFVLWGLKDLAEDANVSAEGSGFQRFALAHNVRSRSQVDEVLAAAARSGGTIVHPARETFWGGYAGYFADPEGFLWEIAWGPDFTYTDEGAIILPE